MKEDLLYSDVVRVCGTQELANLLSHFAISIPHVKAALKRGSGGDDEGIDLRQRLKVMRQMREVAENEFAGRTPLTASAPVIDRNLKMM